MGIQHKQLTQDENNIYNGLIYHMNNILLLSPFFYPEPISTGKYNTIIAKELSTEVDSIDVLCSHPIYPKWKVETSVKQLDGVKAIRGGKWLKFPNNVLLRRAVLEIWFFLFVFYKMLTSNKKYSHVVAIFPPSLFMMLVPMLAKKSQLVGIVHDLQGIYAKQNSGLLKRWIFSAIKKVESRAFSCCDKLIFLSEDMKKSAIKEYMLQKDKCYVHYPFVTINKFQDNNDLTDIINNKQRTLVYSGALGDKQAPEQLATFMNALSKANDDVESYIFSQGPIFESLKVRFPNIHFYDLVEEKDLPELLLRSSIQILPQAIGTSDGSLPSKLPNLLASKCKILCITDEGSELVRILNNYTGAKVTSSWDINNLIEITEYLLNYELDNSDNTSLLAMFKKESLVKRILEK